MLAPALLADFLRRFDIDADSASFIRFSQNYAYACRRRGHEVILRVARDRHQSRSQTEAELQWMIYLSDNGIDACRPIRSRDGELCEVVDVDGSTFVIVCLERVPGRKTMEEDRTLAVHAALGAMTAKLHRASIEYTRHQPAVDRPAWFESRLLNQDLERYVPPTETAFHETVRSLIADIRAMPIAPDRYGLIHADISFGNCFLDGDRVWIFDFDNCEYGHFVSDLATMLYDGIFCTLFNRVPAAELAARVQQRWSAFLDGYETVRSFGPMPLELLRKFLVLREAVIYVHYKRVMTPERKLQLHDGLELMRRNVAAGVTDVHVS